MIFATFFGVVHFKMLKDFRKKKPKIGVGVELVSFQKFKN